MSEARARIDSRPTPLPVSEQSVLEKVIARCGSDTSVPAALAFDMCGAGIDTTGNTLGFLLGKLSSHPDVQERLREEIRRHSLGDGGLTESSVVKMKYLAACLRESLRAIPTVSGFGRVLPEDTVIGGYEVPANTFVMSDYENMAQDPKYYKEPEK